MSQSSSTSQSRKQDYRTHLCENGWRQGSIYDCPKHEPPTKNRPVVPGANTMKGHK